MYWIKKGTVQLIRTWKRKQRKGRDITASDAHVGGCHVSRYSLSMIRNTDVKMDMQMICWKENERSKTPDLLEDDDSVPQTVSVFMGYHGAEV
ncbi:hypothetical protein KQX54_003322 [Cotesia glomerata]|uniref:Uncharacterized protein n=1 Tax=Cotesia glomerata TaxID=32391 RepID=A0AAV7HUC8_COTGL|nr:hypothetical protein KQX54_003322 [Cotesia glomerata]